MFTICSVNGQNYRKIPYPMDSNICDITPGININSTKLTMLYKDSFFIAENKNLSTNRHKVFDVFNTTSKDYYIYSGLIDRDWYRQPYVNQFDTLNDIYYLSLTPLYKNFRNDFQHDKVLFTHYNWFSFIKLNPNQFTRISIVMDSAFLSMNENGIIAIDPKDFEYALSSPYINLKNIHPQKSFIRIGIYNNIDDLCRKYSSKNILFDQKKFKTFEVEFDYWKW
jgi:hypothetical protein